MGEPSPLRNPLGTRGSACVEVMTTLHGSTPSPWRRVEGCVPSEGGFTVTDLDSPLWIRVRGRLTRVSNQLDKMDMDSQIVTVDQFAAAMASIQEAIANLGQRIDGQQAQQSDRGCPASCHITYPDLRGPTCIDRLEQRLRQMRASDEVITWEDFNGAPVANLPAKFRMPEIERYMTIAQRWRELEALIQRLEESVTLFIFHWREKIAQIIDREEAFRRTEIRDVGTISSAGMRPPRHYQTVGQTFGFYYPPSPHVQYRPPAPSRPMPPTYLHPGELLTPLAPKPVPHPVPPRFILDLHFSYHQGLGHDTDHCNALRHAIQDLIDQGLVNLGQLSVTTNPLPAHSTHAVSSPLGDIHHIDLMKDDNIHMLSWDDGLPEPIVLYDSYEVDGVSLGPQAPTPFSLIPDEAPFQLTHPTPLIVTRSGRIAQPPPPAVRPFEGAASYEEIRVETTTTLERLIHMMTVGKATCIVFSDDDLPPEGSDHVRPLYITIGCSGHRVPPVLLDNGLTLNVCPLATTVGPATFSTLFQKVKFIHDGQVITGPSEFITAIDHDTTFGLGFIPTEADYRYMARLRKEGVRARLSHTPFDYLIRPYRMSLADYFVRGSEIQPCIEEIHSVVHTDREIKLQHLFHQLQLSDEAPSTSVSMAITPTSPDQASMLSLCFPEEIIDDGVIIDPTEMIDGVVSHDEVSTIEVLEETQIILVPEILKDDRDVEIVDFGTEDQPREQDERDRLIHLLRSYLDVFAWSYEDMHGLDPSIFNTTYLSYHMPDRFSGYNKILMALEDMEKTTFIIEWGTYCYKVMPFGLKNAGATYQRVVTTLFHDMMHRDVEVYVDDMIVKSQGKADHLGALERFFERIQKFRLRLNPKKCTFGVTSGKLLGHMVSERGIEVDPNKIKAILDMLVPRTEKEIRGRPLLLYLSISDMALGCMLAQIDDSGKEGVIYYLSKRMLEYEMKYVMIERLCLALVWATRRFRHYMTEYSMHLISRLDSLRYLFDRLALTGRLMRWLVLLTKFDIQYVSQKSIKGSIVADHLASLPTSEDRPVDDDFPDEEFVVMTSLSGWCMYFDGAANQSGYGIDGGIGDSNLVLKQIQGDWKTRAVKLRSYHAYLELLVARFDDLRYVHLPKAHNRFSDALATLASSVDIPIDVVVRPLLIELRFAPTYYCLIGENRGPG
ncbi:Retrovirus-related Pol polyprotein from transposon 297 [Vitis vinifera]|uniref:Retrovirus-related Pol polyprotein from transposon 297 n=1 Tax=Vitis vinifera TaxID=29760 RepID=A0A438IXD1_VITVI|nr:Retrovirus-related Pol polyprotein from transposon 297 [Vitis vinifera]